MLMNVVGKFVKVEFKPRGEGSRSKSNEKNRNSSKGDGPKSKICQTSSDGNRKLSGNLKLQKTPQDTACSTVSQKLQVREESVLSSYHRQTMSVFVGARLIDAPGTPC